ncbi:MAG: hypothetical protein NTY38_27845 [Acidobacteria bacterium]|nr:hypothetical protein [Acidobacteriota bacterium]
MVRSIASLLVAAALLVVTTALPCLACGSPAMQMKPGSCCNSHGRCPMPVSKTLHLECGTPALSAFILEKAAWDAGIAVPAPVAVVAEAHRVASPAFRTPLPGILSYSPPELYLLNSVFTI